MLKDLAELQKDIDFIKSELEKKLSDDDKKLVSLLINLQDIKQKRLCNLAYIQGAEAISEGITNSIKNIKKGGNE